MSGDLRQMYEGNPTAFLGVVFHQLEERHGGEYDLDAFATMGRRIAAEEGVNLFRAINEHPEFVEERVGEPVTFGEDLVAMLDRMADPTVDTGGGPLDDLPSEPDGDGGDSS